MLWHLVDIAKVNAWLLYRRHYDQKNLPVEKRFTLLSFTMQLAKGLLRANKSLQKPSRGRPSKQSLGGEIPRENSGKSSRCAVPTPSTDVRFDQVAHWPIPTEKKNRCCVCQAYVGMMCQKCNITLCLLVECNCFVKFHTK